MENNHLFSSPIRRYATQQLQTSFQFGPEYKEREVSVFETEGARYEVRIVECYLTKEEADSRSQSLDESRQLGDSGNSATLFFSSSWFEVHDISSNDLDELVDSDRVHHGNNEETADYLLILDGERKHFSYCKQNFFSEPKINDDCAYRSRALNDDEQRSLDSLLKQRLDTLYRR